MPKKGPRQPRKCFKLSPSGKSYFAPSWQRAGGSESVVKPNALFTFGPFPGPLGSRSIFCSPHLGSWVFRFILVPVPLRARLRSHIVCSFIIRRPRLTLMEHCSCWGNHSTRPLLGLTIIGCAFHAFGNIVRASRVILESCL